MAPINYMPIQEAIDLGVIHEINRLLLHPLGLALQVEHPTRDRLATTMKVWDYRDDPEGIYFAEGTLDPRKAERMARLMFERRQDRKKELGYVIQPVETEQPTLTTTYVDPAERSRG